MRELAMACGRHRTLVFVGAYCGLRIGELAALRRGDVDLNARRITVRRSVTRVTGQGWVESTPKNGDARVVPIPKFVAQLLAADIANLGIDDRVFPSREGGTLGSGELQWAMDKAAEAVGFRATPHNLRHTCASLAISRGANILVLQRLMGHKTAAMTMDVYGHLMADDLDRIADAFDATVEIEADEKRTNGLRGGRVRSEMALTC